jgi:hypothetical protein
MSNNNKLPPGVKIAPLDNKGLSHSLISSYEPIVASDIKTLLKRIGVAEDKTRRVSIYYLNLRVNTDVRTNESIFSNLLPGSWEHGCNKIQTYISANRNLDHLWTCLFHSYTDSEFKNFSWNIKTRTQFVNYVNDLIINIITKEKDYDSHVKDLINEKLLIGLLIVERSLVTNKAQLWFMVAANCD